MIQSRWHRAPVAAVVARPAVVTHHEVLVRRDCDRLRHVAGGPSSSHGLMNGSSGITPLTTGCPSLIDSSSPGPATIRLTQLVSDSSGVASGHARGVPPPAFGAPQR